MVNIVSGIYIDASSSDYRTSLPKNLYAVPKNTGASEYYLKQTHGVRTTDTHPFDRPEMVGNNGVCRFAMKIDLTNDTHVRLFGEQLREVYTFANEGSTFHGSVQSFAAGMDIDGLISKRLRGDYSSQGLWFGSRFDGWYIYSSIFTGSTPLTNTSHPNGIPLLDVNGGLVAQVKAFDVAHIDGYFVFADANQVYHTEIGDQSTLKPDAFASAEFSPDSITGVENFRDELLVFGTNTIQFFSNEGNATGFTFVPQRHATVHKGCVGPHAKIKFSNTVAFVGAGRNEAPRVYLLSQDPEPISTRDIEKELLKYRDSILFEYCFLEKYNEGMNEFLKLILPDDRQFVYDIKASQALGSPVWHERTDDTTHPVFDNGFWWVSTGSSYQTSKIGYYDDTLNTTFDEIYRREFYTPFIFGEHDAYIINNLKMFVSGTLGYDAPLMCGWSDDFYAPQSDNEYKTIRVKPSNSHANTNSKTGRAQIRRGGKSNHSRTYHFWYEGDYTYTFSNLDIDAVPCS